MLSFSIGVNRKIIGKTDPQKLSYAGAWQSESLTLEQLADHIGKGHPWMPALLDGNGKRWQSNANHAELLAIDIDSGMTIDQALQHPFIKARAGLLIESASSTPDHNKFRIVFALPEALTDWQSIRICNRYLAKLLGHADPACKDASRFFFGAPGRKPILLNPEACLPVDFADQSKAWDAELERQAQIERDRRAEYLATLDTSDRAALAKSALEFIPPYTPGNNTYNDLIAMMAGVVNDLGAEGEALLEAWGGFGKETAKKVRGLSRTPNHKATLGSLFYLAKQHGFKFPDREFTPDRIKTASSIDKEINWREKAKEKHPEFWRQTYHADLLLNQRYLPAPTLPAQPGILALTSPMGSGKTEALEGVLAQFWQRHPDGLADLIGYRNGLLLQTCDRINGKGRVRVIFKHHMDGTSGGWQNAPSLAYALNSLDQRIDTLNRAIDGGRMVLIGLDEVDFILAHWLEMMKSQPHTGLAFARLLRRIGEGHGYILAFQADLTGLPINFLRELTGASFPLTLVQNNWQGEPWHAHMMSALSQKGEPSNALASIGAAQMAIETIAAGEFPLIVTTGQEWLETLDTAINAQGAKLLRVDRDTVAAARKANRTPNREQAIIQQLFKTPKAAIEQARKLGYAAIGLTPTAETGVSIEGVKLDRIIGYFPAHTSEQAMQLLARDRDNDTPRYIFARDAAANDRTGDSFDPDRILANWKLNLRQGFRVAQVGESLTADELAIYESEADQLLEILTRYAAKYRARRVIDMSELNQNIQRRLTKAGHQISHEVIEIKPETRQAWQQAKAAIAQAKHQTYADSPVVSVAEAQGIIRSGNGTRQEVYAAQKTLNLEQYPGLDLDNPELVGRLLFDRRGAALKEYSQAWLLKYPAVAAAIDRACWKAHLNNGIIWAPAVKREALKTQTLADTGILAVLELDEYCETTPEVQAVRQNCLKNRAQLRRVCGYQSAFDENHTGVEMVAWLLKRLGYKQQRVRRLGRRGEQVWYWQAIDQNPDDRTQVEAALALKWQTSEVNQESDSTIGRSDFSNLKPDQKIGSTALHIGSIIKFNLSNKNSIPPDSSWKWDEWDGWIKEAV